jgi:hypothetical protein
MKFLMVMLLTASVALAGDNSITSENGITWMSWSPAYKVSYINGFLAGVGYVAKEGSQSAKYSKNDGFTYDDDKAMNDWRAYISKNSNYKGRKYSRKEVSLLIDFIVRMNNRELYEFNIFKITVGQLAEGVDALYADYKNRQIFISDAIYVVQKQIQGASPDEIEVLCQWLRGGKVDTMKRFFVDSNGRDKFISFPGCIE